MKVFITAAILCAAALFSSCTSAGQESASSNGQNATANANTNATANRAPAVTSAHSEKTPAANAETKKSSFDTKELDEKIEKAEEKAKASGASTAEKKTAAEAYLARANVYYEAGQPRLYKFALRDFKRVLLYQPDNEEAKEKMDMIVSIYKQMDRPVPEVGDDEKP